VAAEAVRVAVIGAGRMGRVHLEALRRSERCAAAAVVEADERARSAAAGLVPETHASVAELVAAGGIDAALVATPTGSHLAIVEELAAAGLPILCEKPCGLRSEEAVQAQQAAEQAGVVLQIGYWRRFVPELQALRAELGGELGRVNLIVCHQWDAEPPSAQFRAGSGGIAADMGVHEIDEIHWLLGQRIETLSAVAAGEREPAEAGDPDSAAVLATLSDGTAAMIGLGRRFREGDSCWVEVFADGGYRRVPFMWGAAGEEVFHHALGAQLDAFADAVAGGPQEGAGGADAVAALRAAEALERALVSGAVVAT
jgi:myo-inositol 2-dehydrogenase/D-chiro-inositol 1-dehydrogenase